MTALTRALLAQFWPYLLAGAGVLWGVWKARQSGIKSERAKQAASEARARDIADAVDNDIGTLTPEQQRERLKQWAKR